MLAAHTDLFPDPKMGTSGANAIVLQLTSSLEFCHHSLFLSCIFSHKFSVLDLIRLKKDLPRETAASLHMVLIGKIIQAPEHHLQMEPAVICLD